MLKSDELANVRFLNADDGYVFLDQKKKTILGGLQLKTRIGETRICTRQTSEMCFELTVKKMNISTHWIKSTDQNEAIQTHIEMIWAEIHEFNLKQSEK